MYKKLKVGEWEILDNGFIIQRLDDVEEIRRGSGTGHESYEVWAGFGKTFETCPDGCHSYIEPSWTDVLKYVTSGDFAYDCECPEEMKLAEGNLGLTPDKRFIRTRPIRQQNLNR